MREIWQFRIAEEFAHLLFAETEGKKLGNNSIRLIEIAKDDPRFNEIGKLQKQLDVEQDELFFSSWDVKRLYSTEELDSAELFHLTISAVFEPAGEECGTTYDESFACPHCGVGRVQKSDLVLDLRKVPKVADIAATIADEWIISERLLRVMCEADLQGLNVQPVRHKARIDDDPLDLRLIPTGRRLLQQAAEAGVPHPIPAFWIWLNQPAQRELLEIAYGERRALYNEKSQPIHAIYYQLRPTNTDLQIVPPTTAGINPFDLDSQGEYACPLGHVIGLNLLSEVYVRRSSYDGSDIATTRQTVGVRRGLLRPSPVLLISPKLRNLLTENAIKGFKTNVAHLS